MGESSLNLSVAGVGIRLETDRELLWENRFRPFLSDVAPVFIGRFRHAEGLDIPEGPVLCTGGFYRVHPGHVRSYFDAPNRYDAYAVNRTDHTQGRAEIQYLTWGIPAVEQMGNAFQLLGFEGILIRHGRICIHASCIRTELGGILFSGPSGIGKSTQAKLWEQHRGAKLLNGDRPILQDAGDAFLAWGSPFAGSSACYINESVGVRALVFLRQAPENTIRRLGTGEAFRRIYAGLTMYAWDPEFMALGCDLAIKLAGMVPCYELSCRADVSAVELLEHTLKEEAP